MDMLDICLWILLFIHDSPVFLGHYLDYILIFILGTILAYITNKFSNKILNLLKS